MFGGFPRKLTSFRDKRSQKQDNSKPEETPSILSYIFILLIINLNQYYIGENYNHFSTLFTFSKNILQSIQKAERLRLSLLNFN